MFLRLVLVFLCAHQINNHNKVLADIVTELAKTTRNLVEKFPILDPFATYSKFQFANALKETLNSDNVAKIVSDYSPINVPSGGKEIMADPECIKEANVLSDMIEKIVDFGAEQETDVIRLIGIDSKNIKWHILQLPMKVDEIKSIATTQNWGNKLSILSIQQYLTRISGQVHRLTDKNYRCFSEFIKIMEDYESLEKKIEQLENGDEKIVLIKGTIRVAINKYSSSGGLQILAILRIKDHLLPVVIVGELVHVQDFQKKDDENKKTSIIDLHPEPLPHHDAVKLDVEEHANEGIVNAFESESLKANPPTHQTGPPKGRPQFQASSQFFSPNPPHPPLPPMGMGPQSRPFSRPPPPPQFQNRPPNVHFQ